MALSAGTKLGPYEILSPLGAGGMGEVYRARDTRLGRDVAVKVLPQQLSASPDLRQRFEREARAISSLQHPNICVLHDVGHDKAAGEFLVMELLEGDTVAQRLKRGRLPLPELLKIGAQIADALDKAHRKGVVHRDLKPANIMLTKSGAKLMDFGLAKPTGLGGPAAQSSAPLLSAAATADGVRPGSPLTSAGTLVGTIQYMSPEQVEGKEADLRSDIFALGATLYEMATGERAFQGKSQISVASAILEKDPEPVSKTQPLAPAAFDRVVGQCLAKDPDERFQSAHDVGIALQWVSAEAGSHPTAGSGEAKPPLRRALPWSLAGVLGIALIAVVFLWKFAAPAPPSAMHFSAVTNFAGVQAQPAISPDGRSVAFVSNRDGHFNIYVGLARGGNLVQITHDSNLESAPSWSPDGTRLTYARLNHWGLWDVWEVPALGGSPRRVILNAADPAWSPDGHSLAYENLVDGAIWISGTSGENAHQAVPLGREHGLNTQPRFSPDGRRIAFCIRGADGGPDGSLAVADLESGKTRLLTQQAMSLSPAWSADGRFIYFASSRGGTINIWKIVATGGDPVQITAGEGDDADLDVSRDGKLVVFGALRQKTGIARLDLQAKRGQQSVKILASDPARNQLAPVYSPDGEHLAYFSNLKGVEKEAVWVSAADGSGAAALVQDARINIFPAWTPDSAGLVYSSIHHGGTNQLRRVALSGGAPQPLVNVKEWTMCDVARDGRVLFLGEKGQVKTLDPRTGKTRILGKLPVDAPWWPLHWSPDQQSVSYMLRPTRQNDPNAGLWVTDFKNPPRQLFRGWVIWYAPGPGNALYLLEGKPDLSAAVWKVNWNGKGLTRAPWTAPMLYDDNYDHTNIFTDFDVSPDGRYLAFETNQVLEENIGMIENVR
jgi:Tol biopolymer transport system component